MRTPTHSDLFFAVLSVAATLGLQPAAAQPEKPKSAAAPLTPEQARASFKVAPGLRVELVAAEPQIESPVAMAFDEDGRLWVVEMRDYPNGPPKGQPPQGRIRLLEDRDGDGRYEHSTVFADKLLFANGLLPWRGGLLVTAAPHIVLLRDSNGDGKADQREVLYEGFAAQNPQLRVSHPVLGLDNWIYVANGLRGGAVKRSGQADAKPVNLSGMDFRFDLLKDRYEAISGMGQYGNTFDDWGRRFVCDNRHHLRHVVLQDRYLRRNPYLAVPAVLQDISELEEGVAGAGAKVYPLSRNWTTSNLHAGRFTAACSVFVYRGDLLPEQYRGTAFTCEPTGNLVHQEVLRQHGATFLSKPPRDGVEFLATPDDWTRPVFLTLGPDGAIYVVDMCRAVIEHPDFMPPELQKRPDLELGKDRGRIWRIVPEGYKGKPIRPNLSKASVPELVKVLEHRNAWWRTTAQRLLLERQDKAAVAPLLKLCASSQEPLARLHAAWLLDRFGALDETLILKLLNDAHPRLREQGVLLAEPWLPKSTAVQKRLIALADDSDPQVRFQVALSLGEWDNAAVVPPLAKIALAGINDPWTRAAVLSSAGSRAAALFNRFRQDGWRPDHFAEQAPLYEALCFQVGARADKDQVFDLMFKLGTQYDGITLEKLHMDALMVGMNGLTDGLSRRGKTLIEVLNAAVKEPNNAIVEHLAGRFDYAVAVAEKKLVEPVAPEVRLAAIRVLAHAPWQKAVKPLTRLINQEAAQDVRLAAVRSLAAHSQPEVAGILLKSWRSYTPALRREVAEALVRQPDRIRVLLKEVEGGLVKAGDIDAVRLRQLLNHGQPEIRDRARKLLQQSLPEDRKQVLARYQQALALKGDARRGKVVFQKNCATCHRVGGVGVDVGPDISDSRTRTLAALLVDMLNPNQAIDANYVNYLVTLKNGKVATGLIAAETAASISLRRAENQTEVILRQDVEEIVSSGVSLMPEGLEKTITVAEMADLLSFLKNWRYLDGDVPGLGAPSP